jgi:hypothetical protein
LKIHYSPQMIFAADARSTMDDCSPSLVYWQD